MIRILIARDRTMRLPLHLPLRSGRTKIFNRFLGPLRVYILISENDEQVILLNSAAKDLTNSFRGNVCSFFLFL